MNDAVPACRADSSGGPCHSAQHVTAIKCGRFFDGRTLSLQNDVVVLVEGNRIRAVGKSLSLFPRRESHRSVTSDRDAGADGLPHAHVSARHPI